MTSRKMHLRLDFMGLALGLILSCALGGTGVEAAEVTSFSPQGVVQEVRQVHATFSEPMIPLGDLRSPVDPFERTCAEKGASRWADPKNWIYDFDRDLPAGVNCEFKVKTDLKTLAGQ